MSEKLVKGFQAELFGQSSGNWVVSTGFFNPPILPKKGAVWWGEKAATILWNVATREPVEFFPGASGLNIASLGPEPNTLLTGDKDSVHGWNMEQKKQLFLWMSKILLHSRPSMLTVIFLLSAMKTPKLCSTLEQENFWKRSLCYPRKKEFFDVPSACFCCFTEKQSCCCSRDERPGLNDVPVGSYNTKA